MNDPSQGLTGTVEEIMREMEVKEKHLLKKKSAPGTTSWR